MLLDDDFFWNFPLTIWNLHLMSADIRLAIFDQNLVDYDR